MRNREEKFESLRKEKLRNFFCVTDNFFQSPKYDDFSSSGCSPKCLKGGGGGGTVYIFPIMMQTLKLQITTKSNVNKNIFIRSLLFCFALKTDSCKV